VVEFVKSPKINNIVMLVLVSTLVSLLLGVNGVIQQLLVVLLFKIVTAIY
jgi:hypothetical protein